METFFLLLNVFNYNIDNKETHATQITFVITNGTYEIFDAHY